MTEVSASPVKGEPSSSPIDDTGKVESPHLSSSTPASTGATGARDPEPSDGEAQRRAEAEARIESGEAGMVERAAVQEQERSCDSHESQNDQVRAGYEADEDAHLPLKKRAKVVKIEGKEDSEPAKATKEESAEPSLFIKTDVADASSRDPSSARDTPSSPVSLSTTTTTTKKKSSSSSKGSARKVGSSTSNKKSKTTSSSSATKKKAASAKRAKRAEDESEDASAGPSEDAFASAGASTAPHGFEARAESYEPESEGDEKLYCICQTLYDDDRMMIACDRCDEWYHTSCMKMKDSDVELVDMFLCPTCAKETGKQTTWKTKCLRTGCSHGCMPSLSRYCSERCGILVAASRIAKTKYAKLAPGSCAEKLMTSKVRASKPTEGIAVWADEDEEVRIERVRGEGLESSIRAEMMQALMGDKKSELVSLSLAPEEKDDTQASFAVFAYSSPDAEELYRLQRESKSLNEARDAVNRSLDLLAARTKVLQLAEDRIGTLEPLIDDSAAANASSSSSNKKKSKKKGSSSSTKTAQEEAGVEGEPNATATASDSMTARVVARCGFDERISWEDARFDEWCQSESGRKMLDEEVALDGHLDPPATAAAQDQEEEATPTPQTAQICALAKRKCKRHADWNIVKSADFEVQRELQTRTLSNLSEQTQEIETKVATLKELVENWAKAKRASELAERQGRDEALAKELSRLESRRPVLHLNGR